MLKEHRTENMVKGAGGIKGGFSEVMTFMRGLEP